jgi:heptosyltransferase-2
METLEKQLRILFIQTAFLGDAILSLPALEILKQKFPDSIIDILCIPETEEVFANSPFVNETLVLDKRKSHKSIFNLLKFSKEIKNKKYNLIYSSHRSFRTSLLVLFSEVKESYGFSNSSFSFIYKTLVPYIKEHHEVKRNLDLVYHPDKIEDWKLLPKVIVTDEVKLRLTKILIDFKNKKKIVIAPGSIWFTKKYPAEKFKNIANQLSKLGYQIFLIGSKADRELCESIKNNQSEIVNFAGEFSFIETVELLSNCNLLISNDSAPTHMGMCADIPVLTIYCSTVPEFGFYPYNKFSEFISINGLSCKPCGIHGHKECPLDHFKCANNLNEDIVLNKAIEILNKIGKN